MKNPSFNKVIVTLGRKIDNIKQKIFFFTNILKLNKYFTYTNKNK